MNKKRIQRKKESVFLGDEIGEYLSSLKVFGSDGKKRTTASQAAKRSMNLLVCWQRVAPQRVLDHTDNVVYSTRSKDTEILVYVDSAAYAAELSMDKELYRIKMQQETEKQISDIKFLVSRKTARKKKGF